MNRVLLCGRLTRDPDIRDGSETKVARLNIAVDRRYRKEGTQRDADYPSCVAFGKNAEFVEKYLQKGTKIILEGRLQTGNYTNKDGIKVYTTDVIVDSMEFAESKNSGGSNNGNASSSKKQEPEKEDGFMNVPPGDMEELPFV